MKQVVIENPVINSPFEEPKRHFLFSEDGITNEIPEARRVSSYFVPIPRPKKKGKQEGEVLAPRIICTPYMIAFEKLGQLQIVDSDLFAEVSRNQVL